MRKSGSRLATIALFGVFLAAPARADWNVAVNPLSESPEGVSTATSGGVSTVYYSCLNGGEWDPATTLSTAGSADTTPILAFNSDGRRNAVWVSSDDEVILRRLAPLGTSWSSEVLVSDSSDVTASPSAAVLSTDVFVAYEVLASGARKVVVAKIDPGSGVERTLVATASTDAPLAIQVHSDSGNLWLEWVDSESEMGYAVFEDGTWDKVDYEGYSEPADIESARRRISFIVQNP